MMEYNAYMLSGACAALSRFYFKANVLLGSSMESGVFDRSYFTRHHCYTDQLKNMTTVDMYYHILAVTMYDSMYLKDAFFHYI
jgi:hypothetical protein